VSIACGLPLVLHRRRWRSPRFSTEAIRKRSCRRSTLSARPWLGLALLPASSAPVEACEPSFQSPIVQAFTPTLANRPARRPSSHEVI
jgi:hypothetical protein